MVWVSPEEQTALELLISEMVDQFLIILERKENSLHFYISENKGMNTLWTKRQNSIEFGNTTIHPQGIKLVGLVDYLYYRLKPLISLTLDLKQIKAFHFEIECDGHTMSFSQGETKIKSRIVVVEYEEELNKDICAMFAREGWEAIGFTEADKALDYIQHNECALACLGIVMEIPKGWEDERLDFGKKTGIELARRIKKIKPELPLMSFTVIRDPQILKEMREAGIKKIVHKPAPQNELFYAAKKLIGL